MKHPFLEGFSPDQAEALSLLATEVRFAPGESILRQHETADGFYLIETGEVSLEYELPEKGTVLIQKIGPGELLGLSWLFEPYRWEFNAVAISPVTARFLRAADVRKKCDQDPKLGYNLMEQVARILTERLQATRHRLRVFVYRARPDDDERQVG
ncbi:MAG TPA: cyclic nucleotide-binding domain-containing protein [Chthoniobacterales bacterium]|nr:cyclic nucleotide-binding domain-containing protein [Chthoniobacterales bacterium]